VSELKLQFTDNYDAVRWAFDLSHNSSLRTLETTARSITAAGDTASSFLRAVLSTVTSPLPLDLVVNYDMFEVHHYSPSYLRVGRISPSEWATQALDHLERFKVFCEMYVVRHFRLVLCADVLDCDIEDATRALKSVVKAERMNGGFDYLSCEPLIISEMRTHRTRRTDDEVGVGGAGVIVTCAL